MMTDRIRAPNPDPLSADRLLYLTWSIEHARQAKRATMPIDIAQLEALLLRHYQLAAIEARDVVRTPAPDLLEVQS